MIAINRETAFELLCQYTKSESLIKHALAVEGAMRWYANYFHLDSVQIELWGMTGLLHDFDYEQYPDPNPPDGHPFKGNQILKELGYPNEILEAILGHAHYTGIPRNTSMAKALFAVDELSGFITACALVRPDKKIAGLETSSVKKKMKSKGFASGCSRDDIILGAEELGLELDNHIKNTISALQEISGQLGL